MRGELRWAVGVSSVIVLAGGLSSASAQVVDLRRAIGDAPMAAQIVQAATALTVLSVAPVLLVMMTSFTRLIVALSFVRSGLGLQSTPANLVLISLAVCMTGFIMTPTFEKAWGEGARPWLDQTIQEAEAVRRISEPFQTFMLKNVREKDLVLMRDLHRGGSPADAAAPPSMMTLAPAFMMSELRRGFEIGVLIALPFLVIDLIVSTIVMAMGMMMMPPSLIALPAKVLFFVLIDGWSLVVGSLIRSYH